MSRKTVYNEDIVQNYVDLLPKGTRIVWNTSIMERGICMIRLKDVEMEYANGTQAIRGITPDH